LARGPLRIEAIAKAVLKKFSAALLRRGFKPLTTDSNIFIKGNFITGLIITVYVNDLKVIGKGIERIGALKADLMGEFQMSDLSWNQS
jgi:hypothetical protein